MSRNTKGINFVFFGTSSFSLHVLNALEERKLTPSAVITFPDKPHGRKQTLTANPVKLWAQKRDVEVLEVNSFKNNPEILEELKVLDAELFVVASFGKILPPEVIYLPPHQTLNIHPSLLPRLRGPAPIQDTIRLAESPGVSIMRLDEEMDHGPLVAHKEVKVDNTLPYAEVEKILGKAGGELLADIMPQWIEGVLPEVAQDESLATYTKMIKKEDAEINLLDDPQTNLRRVRAYSVWPGAHTRFKRRDNTIVRVVIKDGEIKEGTFHPTRVIPEGKKEMSWEDFLRGNL